MATWQMIVLFVLAGGGIGCLFGICKAIEKLSNAIFSIRIELTRLNAKLDGVQVTESDHSFEAAIRDIENLVKKGAA